jgi:hypothetical protein
MGRGFGTTEPDRVDDVGELVDKLLGEQRKGVSPGRVSSRACQAA